jgi:hypothetical protein
MSLKKPPKTGQEAWWLWFYTEANKIWDRKLFAHSGG